VVRITQAPIALAWLVATVGVGCLLGGRTVNVGFVAAIAFGVAAACSNWRALTALPTRVVFPAGGLVVLAFGLPALANGLSLPMSLRVGRGCAAFAWFTLVLSLGHRAKQPLLVAAVSLLVVNLVLAFASVLAPGHFSAFERVQHEYAAGLPRFRGLANSPAPAGVWALVSIGLAEGSTRPRVRWLARSLGLLEACASFSIALLAVPALLAA